MIEIHQHKSSQSTRSWTKRLTLTHLAIAIALPFVAKAQDQIVPGQHSITQPGIMKSGADWIQTNYANKIVAAANAAMKDVDKKEANTDLTHTDAINVQGEALNDRWAGQKKLNENLAICQKNLQDARQALASHPGDMKVRDAVQVWAKAYNQVAQQANDNSDRIDKLTTLVKAAGHNEVPAPPTHFNTVPIPAAMPSQLEMQQNGNKPPAPTDSPKSDDAQDKELRNDMNTSMNTRDNLEALAPLALQYALDCQKKAEANPDDPVLQANAELAKDQLNKLVAWHDDIQNRIWTDMGKIYPPVDDKKSPTDTQNGPASGAGDDSTQKSTDGAKPDAKSEDHVSEFPAGKDPIADLLHMAGGAVVAMSSDQGDDSTQKFIDSVNGNDGSSSTANSGRSSSGPSDQARDNARDNSRDTARAAVDAARDAANAARDNAHSARGGMANCPDGH